MQTMSLKWIKHWNGNKSGIRQGYEEALLKALIDSSSLSDRYRVTTDNSPRRTIADEANIFNAGFDVLITTAGNPKFKNIAKLIISEPVDFGILGARIAVYRKDNAADFLKASKAAYRIATIAQPHDWSDVPIYKANRFQLLKVSNLEACFSAVESGDADYLALGANEVVSLVKQYAANASTLKIDSQSVIYYPMPLQIYCHPDQKTLALTLRGQLQSFIENGRLRQLFRSFYGPAIAQMNLQERQVIFLSNPSLDQAPDLRQYLSPLINQQTTQQF